MSETSAAIKSAHQPIWFRYLRVAVGIILIWKAFHFVSDTSAIQSLFARPESGTLDKKDAAIIVLLTAITFLCAFFIMIGYSTRMASLLALLVFSIGVLFVHGGHIERSALELALSIATLFILLLLTTNALDGFRTGKSHNEK